MDGISSHGVLHGISCSDPKSCLEIIILILAPKPSAKPKLNPNLNPNSNPNADTTPSP